MQDLPDDAFDRMNRVTKLLATQRTLPAKLEAVVEMVKRTIPSCDAAGVVLLIDGQPTTGAVSDRLAVEIDLVQYETGQGPCLEALGDSKIIRIDLVEADSRFTRFAPGALDHEINSVLSMPLTAGDTPVGALNLYSHRPNAFDEETERAVQPMADLAAEAITTSPLYAYSLDMVEGLMETLENRALINHAAGIIMASEQRTSEQALGRLRELALASGESMHRVAQWVLEEHPGPPPGEEHLPSPEREAQEEAGS
jgi:GAF domain-containing protein